jgi:membrane protease YdiL (CAAX protease family)
VPDRREQARSSLAEPLVAFAVAIFVAAGLYWLGGSVGFVQQIMHGLIACMFLLGPQVAARISGHVFDDRAAGIMIYPLGPGLRVLGFALLVTWPAFILGFLVFYSSLCPNLRILHAIAPICSRWPGIAGMHLHLPQGFWLLALSQILIVAVPEEVFFRGYLMSRFEERFPSHRRLWGAAVGWPLVITSVLFATGHFLVDFQSTRLAVFFPALAFGWMRSRSGSVAAGAVFHALCNLLSEVLHEAFF